MNEKLILIQEKYKLFFAFIRFYSFKIFEQKMGETLMYTNALLLPIYLAFLLDINLALHFD